MSLLRLLTTGKSLVGLKKLDHRYQLPGQKAIPEFGSKKNPFRATVFPEKFEAPDAGAEQPTSGDNSAATAPDQPNPVGPSAAFNPGEPRVFGAVDGESSKAPGALRQSEAPPRRASALRALFLWGRASKSGGAGPSNGRPLIQAELSLDRVKVVRNDLSESDLEVVPRKKAATAEPVDQPRDQLEPDLEFGKVPDSAAKSRLCEANTL